MSSDSSCFFSQEYSEMFLDNEYSNMVCHQDNEIWLSDMIVNQQNFELNDQPQIALDTASSKNVANTTLNEPQIVLDTESNENVANAPMNESQPGWDNQMNYEVQTAVENEARFDPANQGVFEPNPAVENVPQFNIFANRPEQASPELSQLPGQPQFIGGPAFFNPAGLEDRQFPLLSPSVEQPLVPQPEDKLPAWVNIYKPMLGENLVGLSLPSMEAFLGAVNNHLYVNAKNKDIFKTFPPQMRLDDMAKLCRDPDTPREHLPTFPGNRTLSTIKFENKKYMLVDGEYAFVHGQKIDKPSYATDDGVWDTEKKLPFHPLETAYTLFVSAHLGLETSHHRGRDPTYELLAKVTFNFPKSFVKKIIAICPGCSGRQDRSKEAAIKRKTTIKNKKREAPDADAPHDLEDDHLEFLEQPAAKRARTAS